MKISPLAGKPAATALLVALPRLVTGSYTDTPDPSVPAGVAGMFLSVPVMAAVRIVWRRLQAPEIPPVDDRELESPLR